MFASLKYESQKYFYTLHSFTTGLLAQKSNQTPLSRFKSVFRFANTTLVSPGVDLPALEVECAVLRRRSDKARTKYFITRLLNVGLRVYS